FLAAPFNAMYFGLSFIPSALLTMMITNSATQILMSGAEVILSQDKDHVRFVMHSGNIIDCAVRDVYMSKVTDKQIIYTGMSKGASIKIFLNRAVAKIKNLEVLYALGDSDVLRIE